MNGAHNILSGPAAVIHARISRVHGSSPRETGAEMFITAQGMAGTIGGGQAEWQALARARDMLAKGTLRDTLDIALGPEIGQCCGGRILIELVRLGDSARAAHLARLQGAVRPHVLILGAGHVGRALARIMITLPCRTLLIDTRAAELRQAPDGVETCLTPLPEAEIATTPPASAFIVATHDHGLDFLLTLAALRRKDAAYVGLIGSATKRARFDRFARDHGTGTDTAALICPIGAAGLGDKRPEVIALMTAQEVISALGRATPAQAGACAVSS
ncbi:xanthine dehydrogenase accessory protein XdhC [Roseinatronobacter sp. S2]|uniref:xanthine dehydrogenase accessory protein XdhC n=1 Tax=Roseinatronobacter sp. S2 TaxID=3035471 RepID=UPI00240F4C65|nr:xanthine dehydrogenase accessory protein XdhC [Roseinatronobacter sp. S2]WFE74610.1 xanthine dehydrogenase accessory protein XdhC [Roseinatronobacter sp. S2]